MIRSAILLLLVTTLGLVAPCTSARADDLPSNSGVFRDAIDYTQARTVQIYGGQIGREPGYASGLLISSDGQILTASGLILSGRRIRVVLPDGSEHYAEVVRSNDALQTSLLKIDADTPDYFSLDDISTAREGDWVLALSNVFRVASNEEPLSVTLGVYSSRVRLPLEYGAHPLPYDADLLMIDCVTANPGAPGGALVDAEGKLMGMLGRIAENKITQTRLNYAVPVDMLARFAANEPLADTLDLVEGRAELGIQLFQLGGRGGPAFIDQVHRGSAAASVGLRPDDLIISANSQIIRRVSEFETFAEQLRPGTEVLLVVKRGDDILEFTLTPATISE